MRLGRGTTVLSAVLTLVAGLGVAVSTAAPAQAAATTVVVGLGDSYASGEGAGGYSFETDNPLNRCHRTERSWQRTAAIPNAAGEVQRIHVACSGAETVNVLSQAQSKAPAEGPQINVLDSTNPDVVLVSIGGNDLGFAGLIGDCYAFANCVAIGSIADSEGRIPGAKAKVRAVLDAIVTQEPQATVVLAGYPQLAQGECSGFSAAEAAALDGLSRKVRIAWVEQVMALRVLGKKVRFVDTLDPFKGHGACSPTPWINQVGFAGSQLLAESMHPNAAGYQAYATATTNVLRTDPMRCTSAGCRIRFTNESVYYTLSGGTVTTMGYIRSAYEAEGEETGYHGYPTTNELVRPDGRAQSFDRGQFFFRFGTTRAYPTRGYIGTKYAATGEANGRLGYPVSTELTVPSGRGKRQNFQFGSIFFKNGATQAFVSEGAILDKYRVERYDEGPLGWPKTDYACGLQPGNACRQHFDGSGDSVVYWTPATGAHKVTGAIRDFYASTGWQNSRPNPASTAIAGYPTTDQYRPAGSSTDLQQFQNGLIAYYQGRACWGIPNSDVCYPLR